MSSDEIGHATSAVLWVFQIAGAIQSLRGQLCTLETKNSRKIFKAKSISIFTNWNVVATTKNQSSRLTSAVFVTFAILLSLCYFNYAASDIGIYWIFDAFVSLNFPFEHFFHSRETICSMMSEAMHGNDVDLINYYVFTVLTAQDAKKISY